MSELNGSHPTAEAIAEAERAALAQQNDAPKPYEKPLTAARLQALIAQAEHEAHVDIRALRVINERLQAEVKALQEQQKQIEARLQELQVEYQQENTTFNEREAKRCALVDACNEALGEGKE